jgi:N-acetylglucosaminyl-diphospho-decaprenol L-rhamnosyltransferase
MRSSIIIVLYNGSAYLENLFAGLIPQLTEADELILVDNASSDGSAGLVKSKWPQLKLVENTQNTGFAAACNQAAKLAHGETLVFLNQDTQPLPGWLDGLLAPLEIDSKVGLTTSKVLMMRQPELIHMCGMDVHYSGLIFGRGLMLPAETLMQSARVGSVSGASFAIRQSLWESLAGFDEFLYMYSEEIDLCWRACLAGFSSLFTPESRVLHDNWSERPGYFSLYYSKRNRYILLYKYWHWRTLLLLLPGLLLAELFDLAHSLRLGKRGLKASLSAWAWALGHFRSILQARAIVQAQRKADDLVLLESCETRLLYREFREGQKLHGLGKLVNAFFDLNAVLAKKICRKYLI